MTLQPPSEVGRIVRLAAVALLGFAGLCWSLNALVARYPYFQAGVDLVTGFKHQLARGGQPFPAQSRALRVMAFGDSTMLSGLKPEVLDAELAAAGFPVRSYNFGLPGDGRFVEHLERLADRGAAPDLALLTHPWPGAPPPTSIFHFLPDDREVRKQLFPFHGVLRNLFVMTAQAHGSLRGVRELYRDSERTIDQMAADRGYYFIARESHFPNDELPASFRRPTDSPQAPADLEPVPARLPETLAKRRIRYLFVPQYFREGRYAPSAPQHRGRGGPVDAVGPDYYLYPNRNFSDAAHANRRGADVYTRDVARLLAQWLKEHRTELP